MPRVLPPNNRNFSEIQQWNLSTPSRGPKDPKQKWKPQSLFEADIMNFSQQKKLACSLYPLTLSVSQPPVPLSIYSRLVRCLLSEYESAQSTRRKKRRWTVERAKLSPSDVPRMSLYGKRVGYAAAPHLANKDLSL